MSPEVISKAVKAYFAALRAMDQQTWVNTFAEDAVTYDPVGAPPTKGHQRLGEFFQTITAAFKEVGFHVPLVVRLEGTNVELGRKLLAESGLNIATARGLTEAAKKVVSLAGAHS